MASGSGIRMCKGYGLLAPVNRGDRYIPATPIMEYGLRRHANVNVSQMK